MKKQGKFGLIWASAAVVIMSSFAACSKPKDIVFKGVQDFQLVNFDGDSATLSAKIGYENPNSFAFRVKDIDCSVFANDLFVGNYKHPEEITIAPNATSFEPITVKIGVKSIMKNGLSFLSKKSINFKFTGNSKVGKGPFFVNVPIQFSKEQSLDLF